MKKFILLLITVILLVSVTACGGSSGEKKTTGPVYTVDVAQLDPNVHPADYPLIPAEDFVKSFEELKEANLMSDINNYKDVVNFFKVDGAYYENCDYKDGDSVYKYYGWYADDGVSVLITFLAKGDNLEYFAWTGNGIN